MPDLHRPCPPSAAKRVLSPPDPPSGFTWTRRAASGSIRLILAGELDLAFRPSFEAAMADAQTDSDRVLLDLRALTLIDCANLAVVFSAAERSRLDESVLVLLDPRGQVRRVLDLLGAPPGAAVLDHDDLPNPSRSTGRPSRRPPGHPTAST